MEGLCASDWCVYLLRCADGSLYTGITNRLAARVALHGRGLASRYTRSRLPLELVWCEPQSDRSQALQREAAIKRWPRERKLGLFAAASLDSMKGRGVLEDRLA